MLDSQAGPYALRVLTARPTSPELYLPSPFFRALLLRRLLMGCMPVPLAPTACRCRHGLDPLERAAARFCREAGATVRRAWAARPAPDTGHCQRPALLEWSSLHRSPPLVLRAASAAALQGQPSRLPVEPRSACTLSSLLPGAAIPPSLASKVVAGGVPKQPLSSACWCAAALGRGRPLLAQRAPPPSDFAGRPFCPAQPHVPLLVDFGRLRLAHTARALSALGSR